MHSFLQEASPKSNPDSIEEIEDPSYIAADSSIIELDSDELDSAFDPNSTAFFNERQVIAAELLPVRTVRPHFNRHTECPIDPPADLDSLHKEVNSHNREIREKPASNPDIWDSTWEEYEVASRGVGPSSPFTKDDATQAVRECKDQSTGLGSPIMKDYATQSTATVKDDATQAAPSTTDDATQAVSLMQDQCTGPNSPTQKDAALDPRSSSESSVPSAEDYARDNLDDHLRGLPEDLDEPVSDDQLSDPDDLQYTDSKTDPLADEYRPPVARVTHYGVTFDLHSQTGNFLSVSFTKKNSIARVAILSLSH